MDKKKTATPRRTVYHHEGMGVTLVTSKCGNKLGSWMRASERHNKIIAFIPQSRKNHGVRCCVTWVCVTDDFGSLVRVRYA